MRRKPKKATKAKPGPLRTAIWLDPAGVMGEGPEAEAERLVKWYEEELGAKLDVHTPRNIGEIKPGTGLVLFDFGGMMAGNGLAEDNSRALVRWAEDNPNSLVVVVSDFTYDQAFRHAIEDHIGEAAPWNFQKEDGARHTTPLHNVVVQEWGEEFVPKWFRQAHGCKPSWRGK